MTLCADPRTMNSGRDQMLVSQIPTADVLIEANSSDNAQLVQKSAKEAEQMMLFLAQLNHNIKELLQINSRNQSVFTSLSNSFVVCVCVCRGNKRIE